ncbi:MAG: hypothetical protein KAF27_07115, partial [Porphyrobacter sp.]|nr:hypothetical protein [Porphyrobacter sp.]
MIWKSKDGNLGPGEARTRQRQRTQMLYIGLAALVGGVIGFFTGLFDQGDGSLFAGDWEQLKLPPALALLLVVMLLIGFLIMPLYGFRMIDDYKREHNYIAFTGGWLAVIAGLSGGGAPHFGGFAPPPPAFGIFATAFVSVKVVYFFCPWGARFWPARCFFDAFPLRKLAP